MVAGFIRFFAGDDKESNAGSRISDSPSSSSVGAKARGDFFVGVVVAFVGVESTTELNLGPGDLLRLSSAS